MLRKVRIQNFKSLKDVTLELQKVNLLIGPNNSGKSNFLKGLEKLKYLSFGKSNEQSKNIIKESEINNKNPELNIHIDLEKDLKNEKTKKVNKCKIEMSKNGVLPISRWQESENHPNQEYLFDIDTGYLIEDDFISFFRNLTIYKSDPNSFQKPFPILPNQSLINSDASNIVAFFDTLRDEYPDNFRAIEVDIQKCIPELSGLRFENIAVQPDDNLYKIYGDKTYKRLGLFDNVKKITYWADELSEGTLYFLALLCIIHQPNPPKLLLLEEPEKGIHPRRIREVIDFIFQLVEEKDIQVIMTTHNERVLDEFEDIPESVFVFDKDEEGATQVKNLLKDIIEPSNAQMEIQGLPRLKFTESLGSHWVTGFIGGVPI